MTPDATKPDRTAMHDPNLDDDAFARDALSQLEAVEPSASLLRRVASIPIESPHESTSAWWTVWLGWQARWAIVGALALGVLVGAVPIDEGFLEATTDSSLVSETTELEDALSLAFGAERSSGDVLAEVSP